MQGGSAAHDISQRRRFRKSVGDAICKAVVDESLTDKVWNNEDETRWTVEITQRIKEACKGAAGRAPGAAGVSCWHPAPSSLRQTWR